MMIKVVCYPSTFVFLEYENIMDVFDEDFRGQYS